MTAPTATRRSRTRRTRSYWSATCMRTWASGTGVALGYTSLPVAPGESLTRPRRRDHCRRLG